ncbi:Desiccation protectant protein Lea14 -like protein [Capsicum chinense]|uniref:Water stress-induced ER5 protein n=1 Tax=Capsicum annuum TaxID=4072 RepID=Q9SPJ4_CAPAN|nr:desiccation protectant protein Lea14 homolog [Capsicum annuum]XP_047259066.1 desiccation protectant protein Lea14 homolog [Capsicum annuum]AAD53078.1 water stress-induced ER5 protein [Capsicum annuum]KAF3626517.1 Desiccation protectant protein Lea14 -like protein [Capsicum annuum]PHU09674.1 Desiccation protectant protein Lea14 -like protein [Capsicum chinense]
MADLMEKAKNYVVEKVGNMEKPEAEITDVDMKKVSMDSISYHANVAVKNPYSVPVPIMQISYALKCSGRIIVSGTIPDPGNIKANDTTMLDVPVKVPHSVLVSLAKDIGKDWDIDYTLELGLTIDLPVIGNFTIPLSHSGEIKLPSISDLWKGDNEEEETEKET